MPAADALAAQTAAPAVTDSDIAQRAYELYCARGGEHGYDMDDWLMAERELRGSRNTPA